MFLDFLLSPITSKDCFIGGTLNNLSVIQSSRRRRKERLTERKVEALERIAKQLEKEKI